jgi:uncharacterized protein with GYD domain
MSTYVILTRVSPESITTPQALDRLESEVANRIASECPDVKWVANYAIMGPYDYLDVFEAPDNDTAMRVSTIIRAFGNSTTEIWPATEWKQFKKILAGNGRSQA